MRNYFKKFLRIFYFMVLKYNCLFYLQVQTNFIVVNTVIIKTFVK